MSGDEVDQAIDDFFGKTAAAAADDETDESEPEPAPVIGGKRKRKPPERLDGGSVRKLKRRAGIGRAGEKFNNAVRDLINARLGATVSRAYVHMRQARGKRTLRKEDVHGALKTMGEIMAS